VVWALRDTVTTGAAGRETVLLLGSPPALTTRLASVDATSSLVELFGLPALARHRRVRRAGSPCGSRTKRSSIRCHILVANCARMSSHWQHLPWRPSYLGAAAARLLRPAALTRSTPAAPAFRSTCVHASINVSACHTLSIKLCHLPPLTPRCRAANIASVQRGAGVNFRCTQLSSTPASRLVVSDTDDASIFIFTLLQSLAINFPAPLP
jgi:hypothetical protein